MSMNVNPRILNISQLIKEICLNEDFSEEQCFEICSRYSQVYGIIERVKLSWIN